MLNEAFRYSRNDIVSALKSLGLLPGDIVFFSTSLGMLGIVDGISPCDGLVVVAAIVIVFLIIVLIFLTNLYSVIHPIRNII